MNFKTLVFSGMRLLVPLMRFTFFCWDNLHYHYLHLISERITGYINMPVFFSLWVTKCFFMNIWSVFPRELQYQNVAYFQCSHFGHSQHKSRVRYRVMLLNTTFNNILVISWRSVVLVEDVGVPGENHRPVVCHWQTWSHKAVSSTSRHERDSNSHL
jgi:hypothetical protein